MASEKVTAMIEEIKAMSVLELSELVHEIEDVFGVSAAAAVAAAGCQHGCGAHCCHCLYELSARDLHFCSPPKSLFRRVIFVLCRTGRVDFSCFCQLLQKQ